MSLETVSTIIREREARISRYLGVDGGVGFRPILGGSDELPGITAFTEKEIVEAIEGAKIPACLKNLADGIE